MADASSSYRADIDGLRAIAVLSVFCFHLHLPGFSGGYVGVDVFFVISGYLITGLIEAAVREERFTLRGFYLRRVRRLAPALGIMLLVVSVFAFGLLYPEDMRSFAASLIAQLVGLQNMFFLADGEYFRGADTKPLLHTWTLAVEEQFYLLWPLLLLLARRWKFAGRAILLVAVVVLSFFLNIALLRWSAKASFFLLPARAWELGLGGLLTLAERRGLVARFLTVRLRVLLGIAGLAAVASSVACFDGRTAFPGYAALLPVFGAVAVVAGGIGTPTIVGRALASRMLVRIGLISYPLYLWHWPLIAFARIARLDIGRPWVIAAIFALALVLAEGTHRVIETPVREKRRLRSNVTLLRAAGGTALVLAAYGVQAYVTSGAAYRFPPAARALLTAPLRSRSERCGTLFRVLHPRSEACALHEDAQAARRVLLWGNSHADMWTEALTDLATARNAALYLNARNCRATADLAPCGRATQDAVMAFVASARITDVILASTWYGAYGPDDAAFERSLRDVVDRLAAAGVRTWLVLDVPESRSFEPIATYEADPRSPRLGSIPLGDYLVAKHREEAFFATMAEAHDTVHLLDPAASFCDAVVCRAGSGETVWYRDAHHITNDGARHARDGFSPAFGD